MTEIDTLEALLRRRHSCRAFLDTPIPDATIERILTTAQRVPSWCNAQPWQVVLTRPDETDRLRKALHSHAKEAAHGSDIPFPSRYAGAYQDRRRTCGWALYEAVGVAKGDRDASTKQMMENFRLFGAPHLALITTEADLGPYGVLDCGAYVTAFTLAAEALGVASIPQAALAGFSPFLRNWFDLPERRQIVCGISFGYKDLEHPSNQFRTERAGLDEVVDWRG
ncbi:Nitroreductase family protein [Candidatus Rhodobacter oscarellae]|uniref:Nitroreductase family protein n=1 Tax=Candidatus Rhodobacter oscarellae TaxID=1675527 RepID=A0A0J9E702_9RHOB|nr:nitroreductase [Candidatus Rhodobacter lobularis]KMW58472.1 Nitroreductase family protein [Candidatus Rhodobacter lobularis]